MWLCSVACVLLSGLTAGSANPSSQLTEEPLQFKAESERLNRRITAVPNRATRHMRDACVNPLHVSA